MGIMHCFSKGGRSRPQLNPCVKKQTPLFAYDAVLCNLSHGSHIDLNKTNSIFGVMP